jgi:hypothetical protein
MAKRTRTDCFKHFDVKLKNAQWSRSARSSDGKIVVVSLWQDQFKMIGGVLTYEHSPDVDWFKKDSLGQTELRENLIWARDNCDGIVSVVLVSARENGDGVRGVGISDPEDRYRMRLVSLDEESGAFTSEAIWR